MSDNIGSRPVRAPKIGIVGARKPDNPAPVHVRHAPPDPVSEVR